MSIIYRTKEAVIGFILLILAIAMLGATLPVVNNPTCDSSLTPHIIKTFVCWIG